MQRSSAGTMVWIAGWSMLQVALLARDLADERSPPAAPGPAAFELADAPWRMSARELRVLPGIGERLALAIADARRGRGTCPDWQDVPGIGPRTAAGIRAWLAAHARPTELCAARAR
jgi:hypothetical protein